MWDRVALARSGYGQSGWPAPVYPINHILRTPPYLGGRRKRRHLLLRAAVAIVILTCLGVLFFGPAPLRQPWVFHSCMMLFYTVGWSWSRLRTDSGLVIARTHRTRPLDKELRNSIADGGAALRTTAERRRRDLRDLGLLVQGSSTFVGLDRIGPLGLVIAIASISVAGFLFSLKLVGTALFPFFGLIYVGGIAMMVLRLPYVSVQLRRALREGRCPDCGYDLKGIPSAVPVVGGVNVGPAVCPECGTRWPLVPGDV